MTKLRSFCLVLVLLSLPVAAFADPTPAPAPASGEREFSIWTMPKVSNTKTGCTASTNCPSGAYLFCSSPTPGTCTAAPTYVECNGVRQDCPACTIEKECCDGSWVYCEGNVCSYAPRGVRCDGVPYLCPRCPFEP